MERLDADGMARSEDFRGAKGGVPYRTRATHLLSTWTPDGRPDRLYISSSLFIQGRYRTVWNGSKSPYFLRLSPYRTWGTPGGTARHGGDRHPQPKIRQYSGSKSRTSSVTRACRDAASWPKKVACGRQKFASGPKIFRNTAVSCDPL